MRKQLAKSKIGGMVLIAVGLMFSACAPAAVTARSLYASPCHPPTIEGNAYRQKIQSILGAYYQSAFSNQNDVQLYESIQHEAMKLLATQTERWSDSIDIPLGTKNVRITVTYFKS